VPRVMRMPPAKRRGCNPKKADWNRQWEIHQGTKPATKLGAMTRKSADPTMAASFLITCSCKQISRLCAIEGHPHGSTWLHNARLAQWATSGLGGRHRVPLTTLRSRDLASVLPINREPSHNPRAQSQLALRLLAEASGVKRVGLAPVNPENS
jgi:hypothetical protein